MKKNLLFILAGLLFSLNVSSQAISDAVSGTIVSNAPNQVTIYAKSKVDIIDKHFNNIVLSVSIVDPGAGNRPTVTVNTNHIPDVAVTPQAAYAEGGRYHYDFIANNNSNVPSVNTNTWTANTPYPVLTLDFSTSSGFSGVTLDHWDAPSFGQNGFSQFYFEIIQAGGGDITAQSNLFFGGPNVVNDPGGWGSGTSFAPLQSLSVLPIKFLGFSANRGNEKAILNWTVEGEDGNTDKYEISSSSNGRDFTFFTTVKALNNGKSSNTYTTQADISTFKASGIIYFQIKQIDKDGNWVKSPIRNIRINSKEILVGVYPNPIKQSANVSFDLEKDAVVLLSVTDASGKQLLVKQVQGFKGANVKPIDMSKVAGGNYLLKVQAGDDVKVLPIVKATN